VKENNTNLNNSSAVFRIYYSKNGVNETNSTIMIYTKPIYSTSQYFKNGKLTNYDTVSVGSGGQNYVKVIKEYKTTISEFNSNVPIEGEWVYEITLHYDPNIIYRTGTDETPDNMYTVIHVYGSGGWSCVAINLIDIVYGTE
jgi:hypothetical protein